MIDIMGIRFMRWQKIEWKDINEIGKYGISNEVRKIFEK